MERHIGWGGFQHGLQTSVLSSAPLDDGNSAGGAFCPPAATPFSSVSGLGRRLEHLDIQGDRDFVAEHHATIVEGFVPLHPEVLAVDFCSGRDGGPLVTPRI